jgi:hypothetical protein
MTKGRALSCVALKKEDLERSVFSSWRFIPPAPAAARAALEGIFRKAVKERGRGSSIFFSSRELPDRRSIRNGLRVHSPFRWQKRSNPFGASGNPKTNIFLLSSFIERRNG